MAINVREEKGDGIYKKKGMNLSGKKGMKLSYLRIEVSKLCGNLGCEEGESSAVFERQGKPT